MQTKSPANEKDSPSKIGLFKNSYQQTIRLQKKNLGSPVYGTNLHHEMNL